jgi:hypothetical protein
MIRDIRHNRGGGWDFSREGLGDMHHVGKGLHRSEVIINEEGIVKGEDSCGGKS